MREIKFRMWDDKLKAMFTPEMDDEIKNLWDLPKLKGGRYKQSETIKLMQFTGKHDCTGKPIYEGDIVEFDRDEWGGNANVHVVKWDEENAEWSWGGGCTGDMEWRTVIGNIWQHDYLLLK